MAREVLDYMQPKPGGIYVDATAGRAGHTRSILNAAEDCTVICLDRDPDAVAAIRAMDLGTHVHVVHSPFSKMESALKDLGIDRVTGILFDLGISSPQIDTQNRGFSYSKDGPLDMRMDPSTQKLTAADVVNTFDKDQLANIFYQYGDERRSRKIASVLIAAREKNGPLKNTTELETVLRSVVGFAPGRKSNPIARLFQAIRIYVNNEKIELEHGLHCARKILVAGGILVAISFHSMEDRLIKNFLRTNSGHREGGSRHLPCPENDHLSRSTDPNRRKFFRPLTGHGLRPTRMECELNRRARSAILRAAQRTDLEL